MAVRRGSAAYHNYLADLRHDSKESFEVQEQCSWLAVCRALCPPSKDKTRGSAAPAVGRAEVPLVDVVHIGADGKRDWFFTSRSGRISRKSKKNSSFASIYATFQDIARSYNTPNIAVVRRGSTENVIQDEGLDLFRSACETASSIAAFIPPKGRATNNGTANFRDSYIRTGAGASTTKTYRIGAPLGVLAKTQRTSPRARDSKAAESDTVPAKDVGRGETISAASGINRVVNGYTSKVVRALENFYRCRVLSLSAFYVVDEDDTAWLVHVEDAVIGCNPSQTAAADTKLQFHSKRSATAPLMSSAPGASHRFSADPGADQRPLGDSVDGATSLDTDAGSRSMKFTASQQIRAQHNRERAQRMRGASTAGSLAAASRQSTLAPHELPKLPTKGGRSGGYATRGRSNSSHATFSDGRTANRASGRRNVSDLSSLTDASSGRGTRASSYGDLSSLGEGEDNLASGDDNELLGDEADDQTSVRLAALAEAKRALDELTKQDVTELRSYSKPPASVVRVTRAVMLLLTGHALDWAAAKRIMANSERFLLMLVSLDKDSLPPARLRALRPFIANPTFRPEFLEPTSAVAARFCSWVRGIHQYATAAIGSGGDGDGDGFGPLPSSSSGGGPSSRQRHELQPRSSGYGSHTASSGDSPTRRAAPRLSQAKQGSLGYRSSVVNTRALRDRGRDQPVLDAFTSSSGSPRGPTGAGGRARRDKAVKKKLQRQQLSRLAKTDETGLGDSEGVKSFIAADGALMPYAVTGRPDAELLKPAIVVLQDMFETFEKPRIFLHKLLRKHAGTQALFFNFPGQAYTEQATRPNNSSSSSSSSNSDGSAATAAATAAADGGDGSTTSPRPLLNNEYLAGLLHELLQRTESDGDFVTSCRPFYIVGFGNGGNVATLFAATHGKTPEYAFTLKGLILANSHAYLDSQLSAIYHSSLNVFACFPRDRPDLPVSYFSRFLFSEKYLSRVDKNLVLNIYTAISNPISNDGRADLCRGALAHTDLRAALKDDVGVPLVLIQSTENSLVNAKHVDAFLEGREAQHVWSHQQQGNGGKLSKSVEKQVAALLGRSVQDQQAKWEERRRARQQQQLVVADKRVEDVDDEGGNSGNVVSTAADANKTSDAPDAIVFWLPGGHEVCQESRDKMQNIFDVILGAQALSDKRRARTNKKKEHEIVSSPAQHRRDQHRTDEQVMKTVPEPDEKAVAHAREALTKAEAAKHQREQQKVAAEEEKADAVLSTLQTKIAERLEVFDALKTEEAERRRSVVEIEMEKLRREQDARRSKWLAEDDRVVDGVAAEQAYSRSLLEQEARRKEAAVAAAEKRMVSEAERTQDKLDAQVAAATLPSSGHSLGDGDMLELGFLFAPPTAEEEQAAREAGTVALSSFPQFNEEKLLQGLQRELRTSENHVASVTALRAAERRVDVRLSTDAAKSLWRKCREGTLSAEAPAFIALIAANGDRLNRDGTLTLANRSAAQGDAEKGTPPPTDEQEEGGSGSVESMFESMAAEERKRAAALEERRRFEKEEEKRMEEIQAQLREQHEEHQAIKQAKKDQLRREQENNAATMMQALVRGKLAQLSRSRQAELAEMDGVYELATSKAQALIRRFLTRNWYLRTREQMKQDRLKLRLAQEAQRIVRGGLGRKRAREVRRDHATRVAQRLVRGRLGRLRWSKEKQRKIREQEEAHRASKIQSVWRMYKGQTVYQQLFMEDLAATAVQRVYRGLLARRRVAKQRKWDSTEPGAERLELGLKLIANSKESFERQRQEIEALHRDQEQAESRVSLIHAGLRESERELEALEAELQGIDQLDQDLRELTHEKQLYDARIEKSGLLQQNADGSSGAGATGSAILSSESALEVRKLQADAYALEMAIHMKRAEREKKKKVLESEFSAVMDEIGAKRAQLAKLEGSIQDMELTRQRKDREFARLQRDLMELLEEQKKELDHLREKGVELEVATATSAAAAKNTALTAKKHEQKTQAIFQGTEELLKFQFMSMSLGYFNSLNMLKSLRDMNSDTTSSAITTSAQTALAAATAASAAKIPTMKHLNLGAHDVIDAISKEREQEARQREQRIREVEDALKADFPADVKDWNIQHIVQWLDTLMLGQYRKAFEEAAIDGVFLLELTDEDLRDVLGVTHQLHRKKLLFSRDKLMPLSAAELRARKDVHHEKMATAIRDSDTTPNDIDTVFSLARNGRKRQVEDVLDKGFSVNTEDEFGNTLLIVGAQQVNIGLCEMLLKRQAQINRQNHQGNTALHYAMAYDPSGDLGEFLIAQGADDTLENKWGLSVYDGISADDA